MEGSKLYVGNLGYAVTNEQLKELFSNYGEVVQVNIIEGKGFGFVEMSDSTEAEKAREVLNGSDFEGRTLKVDEAKPPRPKSGQRRGHQGGQRGGYQRY
ncbi:MAG: RNA-binding protein [Thermodesulfovibrionia bacterium]|nr:RNA-binding protein [Thermodesulfovibrionia bacterium]